MHQAAKGNCKVFFFYFLVWKVWHVFLIDCCLFSSKLLDEQVVEGLRKIQEQETAPIGQEPFSIGCRYIRLPPSILCLLFVRASLTCLLSRHIETKPSNPSQIAWIHCQAPWMSELLSSTSEWTRHIMFDVQFKPGKNFSIFQGISMLLQYILVVCYFFWLHTCRLLSRS